MGQNHKLAAIMFSDIVGYSRIMAEDELRALNLLEENRKIHKSIIVDFNGEIIKEIRDGILSIYNSSFDAVNSAIKIQEACKKNPFTTDQDRNTYK